MKSRRLVWGRVLIVGLLVIVTAAALFYAFVLDAFAKRTVLRIAERALRVPIRIERTQFHVWGRSALTGISIVNPPGYREPEAAHFDRLDGFLDAASINSPTVQMRDLVLTHPVFTVDFLDGRSNYAVLISNLIGDPVDPQAVQPLVPGQKFRIERLRVVDGIIRFRSENAGGGFVDVVLPDLELTDFGDAPGAEPSLAKVLALIFEAMAGSVMKVEDPSIPEHLRTAFGKELLEIRKKRSR